MDADGRTVTVHGHQHQPGACRDAAHGFYIDDAARCHSGWSG
jgi:hypothetical protein